MCDGQGPIVTCLFAVLWFACVRICDPYLGCQAPSAHAATISRTAASIVYEYYVFMAVSLTGLSLVFQPRPCSSS